MKTIFWSVLALIILQLAPTVLAHSQTQVIEMTSNGFEPNEVTVDENSTLIFLNRDSNARWPASNVHPTHDLYPQFDPQKAIEPGGSWAFKPKKAGEWKYHDHLKPHFRAILIVEKEPGVSVENINKFVPDGINWLENIKSFFLNFSAKIHSLFQKKEDPELAWNNLKEKYQGQAGSSGTIHDQAHLIGSLLYDKKGFSGLSLCTAEFAFGCYHGFLDQAFKKDLSQLLKAQDACLKLGPENSGPVASCIHGIGHGVASFHQTSDLKSSLADCRKLTSGREYCFDGVFMEFVRSAPDSFFKADQPLYPCDELEKQFGPAYSFACGRNQPSLLIGRFKMAFNDVVAVCSNARSSQFKQACFDALGFSLASSTDANQIIRGCQSIGIPEYILSCTKAAAGELVFQEVPSWQEKSQAVCQSLSEGQVECLAHLDRLIKEYGRVKKINFTPRSEGEDADSYIRSQMKICYDNNGAGGCYKQVAELLYDNFGLAKTLGYLAANEDYPEVYARCHEVTHYLSRSEYERSGSVAKVYSQCDSTCHGGCYHGTLEAYLRENPNADFAKICGRAQDYQKPIEFNECLHGLGHAAMFTTDMELKQSLKMCDLISLQEHRERCYTGVFMENSSSSTSNDHVSKFIKPDDPFYPCNALAEKYQPLCWQYQSSYFSIITNQDWDKVSDLCLQIPTQYQDKCFRTIGTNQVGFTSSLEVMKKNCDSMPNGDFRNICVAGVVSSLSYRFVGDSQKMIDFCSLVDGLAAEACYRQMGTSLLDWDKDKNIAIRECEKIPSPQAKSQCMNVI